MRKPTWLILGAFAGWMLVGVCFSLNDYLYRDMLADYYKSSPSLPSMLFWDVAYWSAWAVPSLLIYRIARRFPLGRDLPLRNLVVNVAAGLLFIILQRVIYLFITVIVSAKSPFDGMLEFLFYNLPTGFMCYGVLLLVSHVYTIKAERREAELTAELTQARLKALQMQLRPHFLANTLNSISSQLRDDPGAANDMLSLLGRFMSLTLERSEAQVVTFAEELDYLSYYLDIEKVRRKDRLQIRYDEVEAQTLGALVPSLILQPAVENAIIHGVDQSFGRVEVVVSARREGETLRLQIRDNGEQAPEGGDSYAEGFGIRNTRDRLNTAYGPGGGFELRRTPDGWTVADFRLPFVGAAGSAAPVGVTG